MYIATLCISASLRYAFLFLACMAANAIFAQRRLALLFPPISRQCGGASRVSRRFFALQIVDTATLPVLPARQDGGNLQKFAAILACN
jgi:hypothetical protein